MQNLIVAFITGLTTGGLSCLAVQGGLLASSLGSQIEQEIQATAFRNKRKKNNRPTAQTPARHKFALPIAAFLTSKLLAYTLLGFLLGLVGSMFQLSPITRAILQIAIGIYMIGTALRMLNVHPFFRRFAFEPPAFLRRRIRKTAASGGESLTPPIFLGLLTVFIPCGITQAMMAVALGTGSPLDGAALMFAFTLGTSPVFFAVAYFATQLGSRLEKHFMRFVAVVVLILGVVAIDTGLTLAGSPFSITRLVNRIFTPVEEVQASEPAQELQYFELKQPDPAPSTSNDAYSAEIADGTVVTINIENYGYDPDVVHAKAGTPIRLRLVSQDVYSCALAFIIPSLNVQAYLEPTGEKWIDIPAQESGAEMPFSCSMGMFTGVIVFDL